MAARAGPGARCKRFGAPGPQRRDLAAKKNRAATAKGVAVKREERVSAAARVTDSPLPVEAGDKGGVRVALVPSTHLLPVVGGDITSDDLEQRVHVVRRLPEPAVDEAFDGAVRPGEGAHGTDVRGSYSGTVRVLADFTGCQVRLLQGAAVELVVHHGGVPIVLGADAAGPDVYGLAVTADPRQFVVRPVVGDRLDVAENLGAALVLTRVKSGTMEPSAGDVQVLVVPTHPRVADVEQVGIVEEHTTNDLRVGLRLFFGSQCRNK